jgi:hypothetical protein
MKISVSEPVLGLDGNDLRYVKQQVEEWIKKYGEEATLEIESQDRWGDNCICIYISYKREEKEAEKVKRKKEEKRLEDSQRMAYEALKKKFEGK